jgi:hypothetical protein
LPLAWPATLPFLPPILTVDSCSLILLGCRARPMIINGRTP